MKQISLVSILLLLVVSCYAQSALVVPLSAADAAKVQRMHQEMLDAEQRWKDLQTEISNHYLVVDKTDPDASDERWYPDNGANGTSGVTGMFLKGASIGLTTNGNFVYPDECDPKYKAERKKWQDEQDKRTEEREAKSRRYRKGWTKGQNCYNCGVLDFEYSNDWKYIVPKPPETKPANNWTWGGGAFVTPASGGTSIGTPITN